MEFVDAHHHLWDLQACHYPWLMARGVRRFFGDPTPIQRNYLVSDLLDDAGPIALAGSVHVQVGVAAGEEVAETTWLQSVADAADGAGLPSAIVAYCDLASTDVESNLRQQCAYKRIRGVRQILGRAPHDEQQRQSDQLIDDPQWQRGVAMLSGLGLSFDLQLLPLQAARVARVLERLPELRFAICHCGSPWDLSRQGQAEWRAALATLAKLPGAACKISGFGMFNPGWDVESIRPVIRSVIDLFGPDRCMFGSNFPVEKLVSSYVRLLDAYDQVTSDFGNIERSMLFGGTARLFYRLAPRADAVQISGSSPSAMRSGSSQGS